MLEAAIGVATGAALAFAMLAPGHAGRDHVAIEGNAARAPWALPIMRVLCALVFVGFGIFVALATCAALTAPWLAGRGLALVVPHRRSAPSHDAAKATTTTHRRRRDVAS